MPKELELIGKQAIKIFELNDKIKKYEGCLSDIKFRLICIGGPLNDNYHKYNKQQLVIFFNIQKDIDEVL